MIKGSKLFNTGSKKRKDVRKKLFFSLFKGFEVRFIFLSFFRIGTRVKSRL